VVEGARLESVYAGNRIVGSNPTPSAINLLLYINNKYLWFIVLYYPSLYPFLRTNT
jgi:hypothetical protein